MTESSNSYHLRRRRNVPCAEINYDTRHEHVWFRVIDLSADGTNNSPEAANSHLLEPALENLTKHNHTNSSSSCSNNENASALWTDLVKVSCPSTLHPNVITLVGALHCLTAYAVTWYYMPTFFYTNDDDNNNSNEVSGGVGGYAPAWVLMLNAYCLTAYYVLDRMDGEHARQTQSTSPVGQCLDYSMDALSLFILVVPSLQAIFMWEPPLFLRVQAVLQFTLFVVTHWQEYYNRLLPPQIITTITTGETLYIGLALVSLCHAFFREPTIFLYQSNIYPLLPFRLQAWVERFSLLFATGIDHENGNGNTTNDGDYVLILGNGVAYGITLVCATLILDSFSRVLTKLTLVQAVSALTKLVPLALVLYMPLVLLSSSSLSQQQNTTITTILQDQADDNNTLTSSSCLAMMTTTSLLWNSTRWVHLAMGIPAMLLTWKLNLFSMGRQAMPLVQPEVVFWLAVLDWMESDARLTMQGLVIILKVVVLLQAFNALWWIKRALSKINM